VLLKKITIKSFKIMKKFLFMALAAFTLITLSQSCKKKLTDEGIQKAASEQIAKMADMKGAAVTVKDGIATVTGECKDQACSDKCKKALEDAKIEGVKSIEWKCTLAPPPPASLTTTMDAKTMQKVKDGMKDIKGVTVSFAGDKVVLEGAITDADRMKVMQMLNAANLKSDVTKLMKK
jgi:hyperosmotically inducible periplasmic protein